MNPIVFALRRPVTVMMLVLALALGGVYSIFRMQKDIFPSLNQPVLYVIHSYGGMDPKQIEGLITNHVRDCSSSTSTAWSTSSRGRSRAW